MRPQTLDTFVGQNRYKPLIRNEMEKAKPVFRHTLLLGPAGVGKTTLASIIAEGTKSRLTKLTGGKEWTAKKMQSLLLNLSVEGYASNGVPEHGAARHVLFIDEIHALSLDTLEVLYVPMEDYQIDHGGHTSWLPFFTLIGATTEADGVPVPLRDRCPNQYMLETYTVPEIEQIVKAQFPKLENASIQEIAKRARGVARIAIGMAQSVEINGLQFFEAMGIDADGLTPMDREYLEALKTGTKSLGTLAAMLRTTASTLSSFVEPYLVATGRIEISGRGRALVNSGNSGRGARLPDYMIKR